MTAETDLFGEPLDPLAVERLADDPERWPQQLADLTDLCMDVLADLGPREARIRAMRIVVALCRRYGGGNLYWPKTDAILRAIRDLTLWAEHDGTTDGRHGIAALGRRYRLSQARVWAILAQERQRHLSRCQGVLPLPEPDPPR